MKMILIVMVIRFIVSLLVDKTKTAKKEDVTDEQTMQHPAEFRIR